MDNLKIYWWVEEAGVLSTVDAVTITNSANPFLIRKACEIIEREIIARRARSSPVQATAAPSLPPASAALEVDQAIAGVAASRRL